MNISSHGLALIESFEGYSYNAYWDSYGRVWTVGYGETQGVGSGSTMTRAQAQADLERRVASEYEPAIKNLGVPLNQNQFDALCSFVWNLGPGSMSWDVGRYLRAHEYQRAADAMLEYDRAGGVVLAGLVRRRQAERALFLTAPKPDPYRYFDTTKLVFSRKWIASQPELGKKHPGMLKAFNGSHVTLVERAAVESYDRHHNTRDQYWMLILRARLAYVAHHESHGWSKHRRQWRWNQMWERTRNVH